MEKSSTYRPPEVPSSSVAYIKKMDPGNSYRFPGRKFVAHPHWIQTREKITSKDLRSSITRSVRAAFCTDAEEAEAAKWMSRDGS